jgi:multicomponent Na+:H+ antiporter subunit E
MAGGRTAVTFVCLLAVWILLTTSLDPQELLAGVVIAALVAILSRGVLFEHGMKGASEPNRFLYALMYLPAYIWAEVKAHAQVMYLIIHPRMPIRPGIVKVPTDLVTDFGITGLANAITMTPGTLTVEVVEEKPSLFVHWIAVESDEPEKAREEIGKPFERYLEKVFG